MGIDEDIKSNGTGPAVLQNKVLQSSDHIESVAASSTADEDAFAVLALRNLLFDICNQNGGGHGGSAIGMAAIGVALFKHVMRYNPCNPDWFDRDRFVLSNGMQRPRGKLKAYADAG